MKYMHLIALPVHLLLRSFMSVDSGSNIMITDENSLNLYKYRPHKYWDETVSKYSSKNISQTVLSLPLTISNINERNESMLNVTLSVYCYARWAVLVWIIWQTRWRWLEVFCCQASKVWYSMIYWILTDVGNVEICLCFMNMLIGSV